MSLIPAILREVFAAQAHRAPYLPDEDVIEEIETIVVELDDTRPFTREELESALNASNPHAHPTMRGIPAAKVSK